MTTATDRFHAAREAERDNRTDDASEAWQVLPLRTKLRILLGDAYHTLSFAVWEIRSATWTRR